VRWLAQRGQSHNAQSSEATATAPPHRSGPLTGDVNRAELRADMIRQLKSATEHDKTAGRRPGRQARSRLAGELRLLLVPVVAGGVPRQSYLDHPAPLRTPNRRTGIGRPPLRLAAQIAQIRIPGDDRGRSTLAAHSGSVHVLHGFLWSLNVLSSSVLSAKTVHAALLGD
jgi:hypothetical protein